MKKYQLIIIGGILGLILGWATHDFLFVIDYNDCEEGYYCGSSWDRAGVIYDPVFSNYSKKR